MSIRFQNLPLLLGNLEYLGWIIDSFPFSYNGIDSIVILKRYRENEQKPNKYAKAKLEFIDINNANHSINAYCDLYEVHFNSVTDFCQFFQINREEGNNIREMFIAFAEHFAGIIPRERNNNKSALEREYIGRRAEGNNPDAIYCYDVKRNGNRNGVLNTRSLENSNKAAVLRPFLYERYRAEPNLSFFFSDNPELEKTDEEIIALVARRTN
ncbi:DUF6037 family protein [Frederiksenia canicola]